MSTVKTSKHSKPSRRQDATSLDDADMKTSRVDRRSFLSRAVLAGSLAVGAAAVAACPSGTEGTDSDSENH